MGKILIKLVIYFVIIGIVLTGIYFVLVKFNILPDIFTPKPVVIADTPVLIKEVKNIAELFSVCHYDEIVLDTTKIVESFWGDSKERLVYIVNGRVYAGFDLSKIDSTSLSVQDSVIILKLKEPQIIDVVVNPSDFTIFIEEGTWSANEIKTIKIRAKEKLKQRAIKNGIIEQSKINGLKSLESFYKILGFKTVEIVIVD